MSNLPVVATSFSNGNLNKFIAVIDGQAALVGSALTPANYGKVFTVTSLADAESQGITALLEPEANRQVAEFYGELAGKQQLYLLLLDPATTMAQMLDSTNPNMANLVIK